MKSNPEQHVRSWLANFVVGLDLCPFARPLLGSEKLRITVCTEAQYAELGRAFLSELDLLQSSAEADIATTLLVFPSALESFEEYLDFLADMQDLLDQSGLDQLFQIASFHPDYQFEGESPNSPGSYSNRSPYPILHLLRENMLTRALADFPDPEQIPIRNVATLEGIGLGAIRERWEGLFKD